MKRVLVRKVFFRRYRMFRNADMRYENVSTTVARLTRHWESLNPHFFLIAPNILSHRSRIGRK